MERKISSSLTEFYKVFGVVSFILVLIFCGTAFLDLLSFPYAYPLLIMFLINFVTVFDFWRMKEVEMTEVGLIITGRFFFNQKTAFVLFKNVEIVNNKWRWFGNNKRISIKFIEPIEFGKEICFLSNAFTRTSQVKMIEELNRAVRESKNTERLNSTF